MPVSTDRRRPEDRERVAIGAVVLRLRERVDTTDPEHVSAVVHGHHDHLDGARTRTCVPVLVGRASHDSLGGR